MSPGVAVDLAAIKWRVPLVVADLGRKKTVKIARNVADSAGSGVPAVVVDNGAGDLIPIQSSLYELGSRI
jgi:hypothetical protein